MAEQGFDVVIKTALKEESHGYLDIGKLVLVVRFISSREHTFKDKDKKSHYPALHLKPTRVLASKPMRHKDFFIGCAYGRADLAVKELGVALPCLNVTSYL